MLGRLNRLIRNFEGNGKDLQQLFFEEAKRYPRITLEEEIKLGRIIDRIRLGLSGAK